MSVAVLRPPVVYGPRDRGLLPFYRFVKLGFLPVYGDGMNRLSWVHVEDAAEAITAVTTQEAPSGAVYSITDGEPHTWRELAEALSGVLGRRFLVLPLPPILFFAAGHGARLVSAVSRRPLPLNPEKVIEMRQRFWVCDNERIAADLGWQPRVSIEAGLTSTIDWYRRAGWL
jgi:nucleoside-diphosphate-sugar epimerase